MSNRGLIFIPDISGFSKFINQTEIEHSRLIIQELLEIIINANTTGLQISEIEGDAILFYRFGELPTLEALYKQVERMFVDFHQSLLAYDHLKYCQCKACTSVMELTLKVITHYGEFTGYKVRDFNKLIGKDLIIAHQLLKNDIDDHEYWLVTENVLGGEKPISFVKGLTWSSSYKQTESGQVPFQYTQLGLLRKDLDVNIFPSLDLDKKTKILTLSQLYATDIITLFHATGDFQRRDRWDEGVQRVEEFNHFLPRIGMRCRCIMENGESYLYSSSYHYSDEKIEFSETDDSDNTTYFTLDQISPTESKLTIDYFIPTPTASDESISLEAREKIKLRYSRSLINLQAFIPEVERTMVR